MKISFFVLSVFGTLVLALSGCKNNPGSLGIGLIPEQDQLNVDTLVVYSNPGHSYLQRHNLGYSLTIAVGRAGPFEADAMLRFSNVPDTMYGSTVNSVDLTLFPNYIAGDSTGAFSFDVHEITGNWTETTAIWDSLSILSTMGSKLGSFTGAAADSDSIIVSIDPSIVDKWFNTDSVTQPTIYGFLLKANAPAGPGTVIRGFESFNATRYPRLRIIATKNSVVDTFTLETGTDAFVVNGRPFVNPDTSVYLQPSLSYYSMLKFDVSALPRNAVIHQAMLQLTRNMNYQFFSRRAIDSLTATFLIDSTSHTELYSSTPPISSRNGDVYSLNIALMVQRWASGFPNQGLQLKTYDDFLSTAGDGSLTPFVFYNAWADSTLRPRLRIIYSTAQ